jgi:hypothetical protein
MIPGAALPNTGAKTASAGYSFYLLLHSLPGEITNDALGVQLLPSAYDKSGTYRSLASLPRLPSRMNSCKRPEIAKTELMS